MVLMLAPYGRHSHEEERQVLLTRKADSEGCLARASLNEPLNGIGDVSAMHPRLSEEGSSNWSAPSICLRDLCRSLHACRRAASVGRFLRSSAPTPVMYQWALRRRLAQASPERVLRLGFSPRVCALGRVCFGESPTGA